MKMKFFLSSGLLCLAVLSSSSYAIIPPWIYQSLILQNTIGVGSCVKVDFPAQNSQIIPVKVCSQEVGKALLFLLSDTKSIQVTATDGQLIVPFSEAEISQTIDFVEQQLKTAFKDNPLVVKIGRWGVFHVNRVTVEVKPQIVQFFTDDISDPYGHSTFLVQDLLERVLIREYAKVAISATTSPINPVGKE